MQWTKRNIATGLGLAAVVVAAGLVVLPMHSKSTPTESRNITKITGEPALEAALDKAGSRLVVIDLYADWCGPCRLLRPRLDALAGKYVGTVDFYAINVDANPAIASAFGTNGIPYVVFVKNKKVVTALVGLNPSESYEKVITACASAPSESCDKVLSAL